MSSSHRDLNRIRQYFCAIPASQLFGVDRSAVKAVRALVLGIAALAPMQPALASSTNAFGPISQVYGTASGAVIFTVTVSSRSSVPGCATGQPNRWVIDASSVAGQAAAALLLSAWAAHKQIWVIGSGACTIWGDTETISYFTAQD